LRSILSLTAAAAAAATLAATAQPALPPYARPLIGHRADHLTPTVELADATATVRRARRVLRFLTHHPTAGTRLSRRRVGRDYRWLLTLGRRRAAEARLRLHPWPSWWLAEATCIHQREGAWHDATGNGYEGGFQFLRSTWQSVGGRVYPDGHWASEASPQEQLLRAWLVYTRDGGSWAEWGTAAACGLR
jgi:Transglycosylase-like domain